MNTELINDDFWEDLLDLIDEGKVIPVIGAGVVTRADDQQPYYPWLARRLTERLGLPPSSEPAITLSSVATSYLLSGGDGNLLYLKIAQILKRECPQPGQALLDLASVSSFNLYLSATFDPLLQRALDETRNGGSPDTVIHTFSPGVQVTDLPARRRELIGTHLYHLLGRVSSTPDYVVSEEDMLEFIFELNEKMPVLERLRRDLKEHNLLFIGLHFSDWLVRFFLRLTKQERLSTLRVHRSYLADGTTEQSLAVFFRAVSRDIHMVRQEPVTFCAELARRWKVRHPEPTVKPRQTTPPLSVETEMPRGAIFISYAREDEVCALNIIRDLQAVGCVVWYDRERLKSGQNWHNALEEAVKTRCGLFLSVISSTTAKARESYYVLERNWAATRAERIVQGEEFYLPVIIDDTPSSATREPKFFAHVQTIRLPGGAVTPALAAQILELQRKIMDSPR